MVLRIILYICNRAKKVMTLKGYDFTSLFKWSIVEHMLRVLWIRETNARQEIFVILKKIMVSMHLKKKHASTKSHFSKTH